MPNPQNIVKHKLPKGKSGNPNGRPKKTVAATLSALKDQGYEEVTAEQVRSTMGRMLNLSRDQLVATGNDKTAPILDALIARALAGGKGWEALQDILDRAHGKAKQQVELAGEVKTDNTIHITREVITKAVT